MAFTKVAQDRPRVLIVGGGYVGFTVAKKIQKRARHSGRYRSVPAVGLSARAVNQR